MGIAIGGIGVSVALAVGGTVVGATAGALHPTKSPRINAMPIICWSSFWVFIFSSFVWARTHTLRYFSPQLVGGAQAKSRL